MNFFTSAKSLRLMAAAGVVAFYCGAGPAVAATYTYTGVDDAGVTSFHEVKSGNYDNLSGDTIRAVGGNASDKDEIGGGGLSVGDKYINRGDYRSYWR